MIARRVVFSEKADSDLLDIYSWIATAAGTSAAERYADRLRHWCSRMDLASERGQLRDDIRPGLRIVAFERRITVALVIEQETVTILRLFGAGRNWETEFR